MILGRKTVKLRANAYTKRLKIYNSQGLWSDTIPVGFGDPTAQPSNFLLVGNPYTPIENEAFIEDGLLSRLWNLDSVF